MKAVIKIFVIALGVFLATLLVPRKVTFIAFLESNSDVKVEEQYVRILVNGSESFSGELGYSALGHSKFECNLKGGANTIEIFNSEGDELFNEYLFILLNESYTIVIWEDNIELDRHFWTFMFA